MRSLESGQGWDVRMSGNSTHLVLMLSILNRCLLVWVYMKYASLSLAFPLCADPIFNLPSCKPLFECLELSWMSKVFFGGFSFVGSSFLASLGNIILVVSSLLLKCICIERHKLCWPASSIYYDLNPWGWHNFYFVLRYCFTNLSSITQSLHHVCICKG